MASDSVTESWIKAWGYDSSGEDLHESYGGFSDLYAYRSEMRELFDPNGEIRATAVLDIEGVPSVCFIQGRDDEESNAEYLQLVREKIWNQNVISILLVLREHDAICIPVNESATEPDHIAFSEASKVGKYSKADITSGRIYDRHPEWFSQENSVDQDLLRNMKIVVDNLEQLGVDRQNAQYMMAQILFVSYLEHREIIGDAYRKTHSLHKFHELVEDRNNTGIKKLFARLKKDLNGDFLEPSYGTRELWDAATDKAFSTIADFLNRVDLESGQTNIIKYDFRYIPVELISGIYESFLLEVKKEVGAFYTPRNLANFVIDQAFSSSKNLEEERIFDGACGSGILLTTAYRRLISYKEAKLGKTLGFSERRYLLENQIFGSDINPSACRVTAFSLYLSMLEGILPKDISELQKNQNVKLPSLSGKNILSGPEVGDFFSKKNKHAVSNKFTLFLSNPPWLEPEGGSVGTVDVWAEETGNKLPRRQLATGFMLRAKDCLQTNGRFCIILPISAIAAHTSRNFISRWLEDFKLEQIVNFGDFRKLLFPTAKCPCVVSVGSLRDPRNSPPALSHESFEYWVPKADVSFAFGRLTLHSADRHTVNAFAAANDNSLFSTLFWGNDKDIANISALRLKGRLDNYLSGGEYWSIRKGFHKQDKSVVPVSSAPLHSFKFLDARQFNVSGPELDPNILKNFPEEVKTVASINDEMLAVFNTPKIVFTDGVTSDRRIKAVYSEKKFCFSSSIGAISGPQKDSKVLKFLAAYLHSKLARYVLVLTAYQYNFERERVTLKDIKGLPFIHPDDHEDSSFAWELVNSVCDKLDSIGDADFNLEIQNKDISDGFDDEIFRYFGLDKLQKQRARELCELVAPNIQPGSILSLKTPLTINLSATEADRYAKALKQELHRWRDLRGGKGSVSVSVKTNTRSLAGAIGIIRIQPSDKDSATSEQNDQAVEVVVDRLVSDGLLPMKILNNLQYAADTIIRVDDAFYLLKPLVRRFWLISEAFRDSERIVSKINSDRRS